MAGRYGCIQGVTLPHRQLIKSSDLPIILDVEASGFGRGSYPIEIGLAFPDGHTDCFLVRPFDDWTHWDPKAESLHGISRETLCKHGQSAQDIAQKLNQRLWNKTVYSDGWAFDNAWVAQLFDRAEMYQAFRIDTLRKLIDEKRLEGWNEAKRDVIDELGINRHRASSDALILQKTISRLYFA